MDWSIAGRPGRLTYIWNQQTALVMKGLPHSSRLWVAGALAMQDARNRAKS